MTMHFRLFLSCFFFTVFKIKNDYVRALVDLLTYDSEERILASSF